MSYISLNNICKYYGENETLVKALDDINIDLNKKEFVVILGPSGAGKTTVLNILGGMDVATSGSYLINGNDVCKYNNKELARFRREKIGFVFQFYNLMNNLTALENVILATKHLNNTLDPLDVLNKVGLKDRINNFPSALSGGEQQRVSIARALVKKPEILLCDEPTGALDSKTGKNIIQLLKDLAKTEDSAVIVVTHNAKIAQVADRIIHINDGKIIKDELNKDIKEVSEIVW